MLPISSKGNLRADAIQMVRITINRCKITPYLQVSNQLQVHLESFEFF
jgi:hypothetical protein